MKRGLRLACATSIALAMGGCNALLGLGDPTVQLQDGGADASGSDTASGGDDASNAMDSGDATHSDSSDGNTGGKDSAVDSSDSGTTQDSATQDSAIQDSGGMDTGPGPTWTKATIAGSTNSISGIWFDSLTEGVVSEYNSSGGAGAVVAMTGPLQRGGTLVDGTALADAGVSAANFTGLVHSHYGLVAPTDESILVGRPSGSTSFSITPTGLAAAGTGDLAWLFQDTSSRWIAKDTSGTLSGTASPTLPTATWTTLYPTNVMWEPLSWNTTPLGGFYESADGNTMMYSAVAASVYLSNNGGMTFNAASVVEPPSDYSPGILVFADPMHGLAAFGQPDAVPYASYTLSGPTGWGASTLPTLPASDQLTLLSAFYAVSDPTHVWLVGAVTLANFNMQPILYASSDGGATFTDVSGKITSFDITDEWETGFALDATHVWLGSNAGALLYSATGGQ